MYLFSYEKLKTLECSSQHNLQVFSWDIYLLIIYKGQNSRNKKFCSKNEIGSKYLFDINQKKYYRNPPPFIVIIMHLTHAFILLSLTRMVHVNFINSCIYSTFLIFRIIATRTNAYTFIHTYEYVFNFYKIIQKLHNISRYFNIRRI